MQGLKIHEMQQRKIGLYRDLRLMEKLSKTLSSSDVKNFKKSLSIDVENSNLFYQASLLGESNQHFEKNEFFKFF